MSTITEKLGITDAVQAAQAKLDKVEQDMAQAGAAYDAAQAEVRRLAPAIVEGTGDAKAFDAARAAVTDAEKKLDLLALARVGLQEQVREAEAARIREGAAKVRKVIERFAHRRAEAVASLSAAIVELRKQHVELHRIGAQIGAAWPGSLPHGALLTKGELAVAVERELARLSDAPLAPGIVNDVPALPGAKVHDITRLGNPASLPRLAGAGQSRHRRP